MMPDFTCPICGSPYFGRDTARGPDGKAVLLATVRCHGEVNRHVCSTCDGTGMVKGTTGGWLECPLCQGRGNRGKPCGWRGEWSELSGFAKGGDDAEA